MKQTRKRRGLIVDDSEMNRDSDRNIGNEYDIVEAKMESHSSHGGRPL